MGFTSLNIRSKKILNGPGNQGVPSSEQNLMNYIKAIEKHLGMKPEIIFEEMQPGDVEVTYADTKLSSRLYD